MGKGECEDGGWVKTILGRIQKKKKKRWAGGQRTGAQQVRVRVALEEAEALVVEFPMVLLIGVHVDC